MEEMRWAAQDDTMALRFSKLFERRVEKGVYMNKERILACLHFMTFVDFREQGKITSLRKISGLKL